MDRRKNRWFGIHLSLRYHLTENGVQRPWGKGITRNMSCDWVAFKGSHELPEGSHVEMWIDWPVR
jgi:hypothetical protein